MVKTVSGERIANMATNCGAVWAGVEKLALSKDRYAVAASFHSEHDAEEFCIYAREWLRERDMFNNISRDLEFVLIWL